MKALIKRVEEKTPADVDKIKANLQTAVKRILGSHGDLQFFTGESGDAQTGMVVLGWCRLFPETFFIAFVIDGLSMAVSGRLID